MIKTDLDPDNETELIAEESDRKARTYTILTVLVIAVILVVVTIIVIHNNKTDKISGSNPIILSNTKALPLASPNPTSVTPNNSSTQTGTTQSSAANAKLGSDSYNLQNNVPTGTAGQPSGSSLQSASSYPSGTSF